MSLTRTYLTLPGQQYALISLVGPDQPQRSDKLGLKIYSTHSNLDDAKSHAARLQKEDATFDILVVETCVWALIPPDKSAIADTHYVEDKLEEIFQEYKKNKAAAAAMFDKRKRDMMAKPIEGSDTPYIDPADENSRFYTKPDVAPIPHPGEILEQLKLEFPERSVEDLARLADLKVLDIIAERKAQASSSQISSSSSSSVSGSGSESSLIKDETSEPSSSEISSSSSVPSAES
jgi:hypothetical protein